jgi:hypothetical protein
MEVFIIQNRLDLKVLDVGFGKREDINISKNSTEPPLILDKLTVSIWVSMKLW